MYFKWIVSHTHFTTDSLVKTLFEKFCIEANKEKIFCYCFEWCRKKFLSNDEDKEQFQSFCMIAALIIFCHQIKLFHSYQHQQWFLKFLFSKYEDLIRYINVCQTMQYRMLFKQIIHYYTVTFEPDCLPGTLLSQSINLLEIDKINNYYNLKNFLDA